MSDASLWTRAGGYLLSGLAGIVITAIVQEWFDAEREKRDNLQTYVVLFHDSHIGEHKDRILAFMLDDATQETLRAAPTNRAYAEALIGLVDDRPDVSVSLVALTEFLRGAARCAEERRCDEDRTLEAFRLYVNDFYPIFFPILRRMDCAFETGDAEDSILKFYSGQLADTSRCKLVEGL